MARSKHIDTNPKFVAVDPAAQLLSVVLFAYSRGIVSSRAIARACEEHVTFIALCGDTATALHHDCALRELVGSGHRADLRGGPRGVRQPRPDRARDVRDRRREAAQ